MLIHLSAPAAYAPMDPRANSEIVIQGIPASQGIAHGQVFLYLQSELEIPRYTVEPDKRDAEIARFEQALLVTRRQISQVQEQVRKNLSEEEA